MIYSKLDEEVKEGSKDDTSLYFMDDLKGKQLVDFLIMLPLLSRERRFFYLKFARIGS